MLEGKVVLVTGGASGIGRASSLLFSKKGAKVIVADIDTAGGEETVERIKRTGNKASFIEADIANKTDVKNMIDKIVIQYGRLNCAFNNAGIEEKSTSTTEITEEIWEKTIRVNLKGTWLCMKYEISQMIKQGGGAIVNTSSIYGHVGVECYPAYVASKHGIMGLTRVAAIEYANKNIRVNSLCPGAIYTPVLERCISENPDFEAERITRYPLGRLGKPEEIAEAAAWLLSDVSSFVTGQGMMLDGGYTAR